MFNILHYTIYRFIKDIKLKRKEKRKKNLAKLTELKNDLKLDDIKKESRTDNTTMKNVNKLIMKKDERFKHIPTQLKKIRINTQKSKHIDVTKSTLSNREQKNTKKIKIKKPSI